MSLLYAADHLGLSSLDEFKVVMNSFKDPKNPSAYN